MTSPQLEGNSSPRGLLYAGSEVETIQGWSIGKGDKNHSFEQVLWKLLENWVKYKVSQNNT